ncbi:MAG: bile acid:sodium symporter, partial [Puniceicoccales bacterium]
MTRFLLSNRFVIGVLAATLLAAVFPQGGAKGGWLAPEWTTKLGVIVIFFLQGLILPTEELVRGLRQWKPHVFTQLYIFVVMPLLAWAISAPLAGMMGPALTFGCLFLGILPCTISTSVVYATKCGGSAIVGLFNTALANVAGVFIVPLCFVWWTGESGQSVALGPMLGKVAGLLLAPLLV